MNMWRHSKGHCQHVAIYFIIEKDLEDDPEMVEMLKMLEEAKDDLEVAEEQVWNRFKLVKTSLWDIKSILVMLTVRILREHVRSFRIQ